MTISYEPPWGLITCETLSVACGDSSPKGRAKRGLPRRFYLAEASMKVGSSLE